MSFLNWWRRPAARWDRKMPFSPDGPYVHTSVVGVVHSVDFPQSHLGKVVFDKVTGFIDLKQVSSAVSFPVAVALTDAVVGDDPLLYQRVLEDWQVRGVPVVYAQRADGLAVLVEEADRRRWLLVTR